MRLALYLSRVRSSDLLASIWRLERDFVNSDAKDHAKSLDNPSPEARTKRSGKEQDEPNKGGASTFIRWDALPLIRESKSNCKAERRTKTAKWITSCEAAKRDQERGAQNKEIARPRPEAIARDARIGFKAKRDEYSAEPEDHR
jgi:hypothetical protein